MVGIEAKIKDRLQNLSPTSLDVINDSAKHAGHAGDNGTGESHFRVRITTANFEGLSRVARHQMINNALSDLFDQGLHALSITALAPEENSR